jgi:hypothetical protein
VLASYHLGPLTEGETRGYIEHRLRTVGWTEDPVWEDAAFAAVHAHTGGIPRRINTLCSRVLLYGALEEVHVITADIVDSTAEELGRDLGAGIAPAEKNPFARPSDEMPDDVLKRIETLERSAFRQEQAFRRVIDLLEANLASRA